MDALFHSKTTVAWIRGKIKEKYLFLALHDSIFLFILRFAGFSAIKVTMIEDVTTEAKTSDSTSEEMMEAGLHFGHKTSKTHPKMKQYIAGVRNTIHIINLDKTKEKLDEALNFIHELLVNGKVIVLVGTKVQTKDIVRETALECGVPYVTERWIGGLFTNFETISKRIEHLKELEAQKAEGELEKFTKKEQLEIADEVRRLERKFGGLKSLERLPDAIFVFDLDENQLAVREAKQTGVTVIAISDTNTDPSPIDYVVPANDDAASSIRYILGKVKETILKAKSEAPNPKSETSTNVQNSND